jgi:hypothetical protein
VKPQRRQLQWCDGLHVVHATQLEQDTTNVSKAECVMKVHSGGREVCASGVPHFHRGSHCQRVEDGKHDDYYRRLNAATIERNRVYLQTATVLVWLQGTGHRWSDAPRPGRALACPQPIEEERTVRSVATDTPRQSQTSYYAFQRSVRMHKGAYKRKTATSAAAYQQSLVDHVRGGGRSHGCKQTD